MIERLMDPEYPYGGAEDRQLVKQATALSNTLSAQLDESGKKLLNDLLEIDLNRIILVQEDAFAIGVCTGVKLMCEVQACE